MIIFAAMVALLTPGLAFAYVDPNTAGPIFQMLFPWLSVLLGLVLVPKRFFLISFYRIRSWVRNRWKS